uniref:KHDC4/BBP-like KH-domain type I domain-containing protein n=1 Tax=Alexandrium monilatum TaxID=311494 RepID=A0A7S4SZI4_9DINO|mmetsp:Transcript_82807/g.247054  ORF Transcript_82807/g.247054 Transcript_82807/m.247054 type:complete len:322 (+) Transcript_82807:119-1084(+)
MPKGERWRSRSRSRQNGGHRSLEQQLSTFRRRYPTDARAFEFLEQSHPRVVEKVLADWRPPRENQDDYSALLTNFVRQVRSRLGFHNRRPQAGGQELRGNAAGRGSRGINLRELLAEVAMALGRGQEDVESFAALLEGNWFDTVESLEEVTAQDLAAVGLPLRFAKELLMAASRKAQEPEQALAHHTGYGGKGGRFDGGKGKSKSKGKGKGGSKGKDRERDDRTEDEEVRTIPVQLHGIRPGEQRSIAGRIVGSSGEHLKYIRTRTRADVWLEGAGSSRGDQREPLCVRVRADSHSKMDHAVELVEDLLKMVLKESRRHGR